MVGRFTFSRFKPSQAETENRLAQKLAALTARTDNASRFVLFLGDEGAILVFLSGGKVMRRLYAPSAEPEHTESLIELMRANPKAPLYLLVDMIDQSYVRHTLPPVSPLGVHKLVQRRLDRDFVPEDIKGSLSLGREKTGRKEWNFLLIALANSAVLQQWLDLLLELPNRFAGIHLVPVEAQAFIAELAACFPLGPADVASKWQLLVTHDKVSGFRQVVLKDGRLIFTRLTQASADSSPQVLAGNVEQEILNTIEYLRRLSYNEQTGLDIFIIVAQDIRDEIDPNKLKAINAYLLTPFEVSQKLGLGQAALASDRFGDVVLSTSFAKRSRPTLRLFSAYGRRLDHLYKGRQAVKIAAVLAVAVMAYHTLSDLMTTRTSYAAANELNQAHNRTQQELQRVNQAIAGLGEDQNLILNAAAVYKASKSGEYRPLEFVRSLGPVLKPGALVRRISWQNPSLTPAGRGVPPAQATGGETGFPFNVSLEIELNDHGGQRQQLIAQSDAFLTRLKTAFPAFLVKNEKLSGTTAQNERLVLNFDDPAVRDSEIKEGENILKVTLNGPLPQELLNAQTTDAITGR